MNVIDAVGKLYALKAQVSALDKAVEHYRSHGDCEAKSALHSLKSRIETECAELESKISEVQI